MCTLAEVTIEQGCSSEGNSGINSCREEPRIPSLFLSAKKTSLQTRVYLLVQLNA